MSSNLINKPVDHPEIVLDITDYLFGPGLCLVKND